jgi:FAD/FMN-containing dehydrogenase/Fe-S oxidoreductase
MTINHNIAEDLENLYGFQGELFLDEPTRILYATDASVYREIPQAVAVPKDKEDVRELIEFAKKHNTSLIFRTAGTSIAGQVVGGGVVVDVSKYFTNILEINEKERWVRVQPGVVLDELNNELKPYGLFFSPETSTSNRCMMGGMVGNNSCGAHSLIYGSTRDHIISVETILSDSSDVSFGPLSKEEFDKKCSLNSLEGEIYRTFEGILSNPNNQKSIRDEFPDQTIRRRNTGYAIDVLLETELFSAAAEKFNIAKFMAGSEGTLAFISEIKLSLDPLPPKFKGLVCVHCATLEDALKANLIALTYKPDAVELMDRIVMEQSKTNITQRKNRFFIKDDPEAILIVEFSSKDQENIKKHAREMEAEMRKAGFGFHFPLIFGEDIRKVWEVRKAGLGLLANVPGDAKPFPFVEDTAVKPVDLPDYISEFKKLLAKYELSCAYNAHIGTGELHLRPVLNLKKQTDVDKFYELARDTAHLIKKYNGSLSGEHGDGRLRGEFLSIMIGENNLNLLTHIKRIWDPENIFNQGKIFNTPKMNSSLRYEPGRDTREINTYYDFSKDQGYLRSIEKCNGSGDCRKSEKFAGNMCPSFQATRDEKDTTRARANILREYLSRSEETNPFNHQEVYDILDLCLSCKACKSECPSNVDMTKLKAEFLQHFYDSHLPAYRTIVIGRFHDLFKLGSKFPGFINAVLNNKLAGRLIKKNLGFAPQRSFPKVHKPFSKSLVKGFNGNPAQPIGKVFLFSDEFTEFNDGHLGLKAVQLLNKLGYEVIIPKLTNSGRALLSKGFLKRARKVAEFNISVLSSLVSKDIPLIGIEPSAILSFRDDYIDLVSENLRNDAKKLAANTMLFEEFFMKEVESGKINKNFFTDKKLHIKYHGHCHQKALATTEPTIQMMSVPQNYEVEQIDSGCCGMAGSFGFEKEHYEISMKIGELKLFPAIRRTDVHTIIAASGTSCRQQILDGTDRNAFHPIEILFNALKVNKQIG